jgi:glycosyltransferase involved in cell wall biosynthesis
MDKNQPPMVSFVIPVYNEEDHLLEFLKKIDALELKIPKELIIINDNSGDSSWDILSSFKFSSKAVLINKETNQGKGAALRDGFMKASGSIIAIQDADFEYDLKDIPSVLEPILLDDADVVYGSRYKNSLLVHRTFHYLINKFLTVCSNLASGLYLSDMETCYKFFKAEIIKNMILESDRFGFEPEVTAKVARLKLRLAEVPIRYFPRNYIEGKKITWKDGIAAIWHILQYNYLKKWNQCFTKELPEKYIPKGQHWL